MHNMTWFLSNIYPELVIPEKHGLAWGEVRGNSKTLNKLLLTVICDCVYIICITSHINFYYYADILTILDINQNIYVFMLWVKGSIPYAFL